MNVNGKWVFHQGGVDVTFDLVQDQDGGLTGSGSWSGDSGTLETGGGGVFENDIFFTVNWRSGAHGRYQGSRGPDRRLSGVTFDIAHPENQALWFTTQAIPD
ncbi:hypothetical protein ABZ419_09705 [Streptomyces cinnamoneus]|uniref:hypothetical protein n=1 Tax=Streptomyces cinnamoneus TaxID=53446 RepID=UPI0033F8989E